MSATINVNNMIAKPDTTKQLEMDKDGYYKICLGGFNIFNSHNIFYRVKDVNGLLNKKDSVFYRRLHTGYLNGEANHPKQEPGMSNMQFYYRNLQISMDMISHHIRPELELIPVNKPANVIGAGESVKILGWIKPVGAFGNSLKASLDNPNQNVAFSIRCITSPVINVNGYMVKDVLEVITWDWVDEPGIKNANKWSTISNESYLGVSVDVEDLIIYSENNFDTNLVVSTEAEDIKEINQSVISKVKAMETAKSENILFKW